MTALELAQLNRAATMDTLVVYDDDPSYPPIEFRCANGFVSRCVSAVADRNYRDAERVCEILNAHFANGRAI